VVLEAGEAEARHLFLLEICVVLIGLFREMLLLFWEICERPKPEESGDVHCAELLRKLEENKNGEYKNGFYTRTSRESPLNNVI
jgi:hypothetical protein